MIIKTRSFEYNYVGLQLLNGRLPDSHGMKELIHTKMQMARAGIHGETRVDKVFQKYSFPFKYVVLHDVSLESYGNFQIDTVFLTQYFVVILESKNIGGKLNFKQNPSQLERKNEHGEVTTFESPEVQLERNKFLLEEWLEMRGVRIPLFGVIVLTNSKIIVEESPVKFPAIIHSMIPVFLRGIIRDKEYLELDQMYKLAEQIAANHKPYFPYPMCKRWSINPNDLLTGVFCEKCQSLGMLKRRNGWCCMKCGYMDRLAHEKAIQEWFVLVGKSINNRQCRYFLRLESHHIASRILQSMDLSRGGTSKNTIVYTKEWSIDQSSGIIDQSPKRIDQSFHIIDQ